MNTTIRAPLGAGLVVAAFSAAVAKLPPAPPLTDEQKAEKAAKDKAAADTAKAELARAEDKAVASYMANMKAKGVAVNPQMPASAQPAAQPGGAPAPQAVAAPSGAQPSPADAGKGLPSQPEKASNAHSPAQK
jgi:hypothetical protein